MENPTRTLQELHPETEDAEETPVEVSNKGYWLGRTYCQYKGFWFFEQVLPSVVRLEKNFRANDTDIILTSMPKSGTTWLKALAFSIMNRQKYLSPAAHTPLLTTNPHGLVPFLEMDIYAHNNHSHLIQNVPTPRLFASHIPWEILSPSLLHSKCRIIYICRNPLDQFISHWQFGNKMRSREMILKQKHNPNPQNQQTDQINIDEAFESFCQGIQGFGPCWDHELGYWNASRKYPDKVLFLTYENLKANAVPGVKKIAEFMGFPFSEEEERNGLVEEIEKLCSFQSLKNSEANMEGKRIQRPTAADNSFFFRKGEVGDWVNYLTPDMAQRVQNIMDQKFGGDHQLLTSFACPTK